MVSCHLWEMEEIPSIPINTPRLLVTYPWDRQDLYAHVLIGGLGAAHIASSENPETESSSDISALKWP